MSKKQMTPKDAFYYYQSKAIDYLADVCEAAEKGQDGYAKLLIGFYNDAVRDMNFFEKMLPASEITWI